MKKTFLATLFPALVFLNPVFGQENLRVDWSSPNWLSANKYIPQILILGGQRGTTIVNEKSQPPSPFDNKAGALLIQTTPEDNFWFRLLFRPFAAESVSSGVVEFNIRPVEGAVMILAGSQPLPWNPESSASASYGLDPNLGSTLLTLEPGQPPIYLARKLETNSISQISSNTNYRVTIKWNLTLEQKIIRVFLNGEPLRLQGSPEPINWQNPKMVLNSINVFRISLGSSENKIGKFYLGPISAATGPNPVLDKSDDPLIIK